MGMPSGLSQGHSDIPVKPAALVGIIDESGNAGGGPELQGGRRAERDVRVHRPHRRDERRGSRDPPDAPARERQELAGRWRREAPACPFFACL
jgi:hypothetical protein